MWILKVLSDNDDNDDDDDDDDTVLPQILSKVYQIYTGVSNVYMIETSSIENMHIVAWFPLLLYRPSEYQGDHVFCVNW